MLVFEISNCMIMILVWIVDISSCAIEEVAADIVGTSERLIVFRLTFPLTLARRSFRNSASVRDWIELDVGGLIPGKHDICMCMQLRGIFVTAQLFSDMVAYFADHRVQNNRQTSANMTTNNRQRVMSSQQRRHSNTCT